MGVFQGDVIIKAMIDLSIDEMRKNPWLLDDVFASLKVMQYISDKYGQANIDAAKEWFANNKIDVYMRPRNDKDIMPFVSVLPGGSQEKTDMKTMGDSSPDKVTLLPLDIGKPIAFVMKPFTPISYDPNIGAITLDPKLPGFDIVEPGMVLVDPANGQGYIIQDVVPNTILIDPGIVITATQFGVVPQYQFYEARVEHTWNQETYSIGCYAHGDPQNLIWLHSIVYYAILRYREVLLEGNGFDESVVSSGEISEDPNYEGPGGEEAFCRFITITGQVEQSWIKAPKRFIESIQLKERNGSLTTTGIKIISNENAPAFLDPTQEPWTTIIDTESDDETDSDEDDS
jgi:hypothetical protein